MSDILVQNGFTIENSILRWQGVTLDVTSIQAIERRQKDAPLASWLNWAIVLFALGIAMTWGEFAIVHGGNAQTVRTQNFCIVALIISSVARFLLPLRELVVMVTTVGNYTLLDTGDAAYANAFADQLQQHVSAAKRGDALNTNLSSQIAKIS